MKTKIIPRLKTHTNTTNFLTFKNLFGESLSVNNFCSLQFGIIAAKKAKRLLQVCVMLLTMLLFFGLQAFSAANTWTGPAGGDWNTASNWSIQVPVSIDAVVIPEGCSVVISGSAECNNLTINSGATVTNNGTLSIGNLLSGPGELINGASAVLNIGGDATIATLTATADGNTVDYNGEVTQSVKGTTYVNLITSGSEIKTLAGPADVSNVLTVKAGTTLDLGINSLGASIPPPSVDLECGASTGSVISGTGTLYLGYIDENSKVKVNSVTSGTGGATISCPLVMNASPGSMVFDVANDGTSETDLTVSGVISTNLQVGKTGEGTLMLSGLNTHTNLTNIHAGTLKLGSAGSGGYSPLGTAAEGTWVFGGVLDLNGYTLSTNETLYLTGTGISNGGALINSSTNPVSYSGYINLASASSIGTTGNITKVTLAIRDYATTSQLLTKVGEGKLTLNVSNSTKGGINITDGTVELGAKDLINNIEPIILNGGTFSTGESTGFNETVATLALTDNSSIHLGTGAHSLHFSASDAVSWISGKKLTIKGWTGIPGLPGTSGKIYFGASAGSLTAEQLSQITFEGYGGTVMLLSDGELVPLNSPVLAISGNTDHGTECVGGYATPVTYTITNTGTVTAEGVTAISDNSEFIVVSTLTSIAAGGSATFDILFNPSASGTRSATVTVSSTTAGANSPTYALTGTGTATGTWLGITSTDWNTASNWCGGIPTATTDAIVSSGTPFQPVISSPAYCLSLTVNNGATVTNNFSLTIEDALQGEGELINGGYATLNIGGDATIATLTATSDFNSVKYTGTGAQIVKGTTYCNLVISGSGTKSLGVNTDVRNLLGVEAGNLDLGNYSLGAIVPPNQIILTCGSSTGSSISGTGKFYLGGTLQVKNQATGNNGASISCPLELGGSRVFDVENDGTSAGDLTITGEISGTGFGINKYGEGTLTLSSVTGNSFTGLLFVYAGTVQLGNDNAIPEISVYLQGGTLSTGLEEGFNETIGSLGLFSNSTIHMGTGSHSLNITASNGVDFVEGYTLTITGWEGTAGSSGTEGKIYFGTSAGTLTAGQLSQITFEGYTGTAVLLSDGELVPQAAAPVPVLAITGNTDHGTACMSAFPVTYTITNTGTAAAEGVSAVSDNTEFLVVRPPQTTIAAGGTTTFDVMFNPLVTGLRSATITVLSTTSGANSPTYAITGTGISSGTWLGETNTDWDEGANWCGGNPPDESIDVVINAGTTYTPVISSISYAVCKSVTVNAGATVTNNGKLTIGNSLSGEGELINGGLATLYIGGDVTITSLKAIGTNNNIIYNGASQVVKGTTYANLDFSGSGIKTLDGDINFYSSGRLVVDAGTTLDLGTNSIGETSANYSISLLSGASSGSIISGSGTLYMQGTVFVNAFGSYAATISCPMKLGGTWLFWVNDDGSPAAELVISGIISGDEGVLQKNGEGAITLSSSTGNTFSSALDIYAGTIQLGNNDVIPQIPVSLSGGTLSTGLTAGYNETIVGLGLYNNSVIHLGTGSHSLNITASNGVYFDAGVTLTITGWIGTPGSSGTEGKIYFGTSAGTLTAAQLSQITFEGYTGTPVLLSDGELVPGAQPLITVGTISDFGDQCINTSSSEQSYTVSGSGLTTDILITPPAGFEISKTSGSGFSSAAITLTPTDGSVASTPIYIRFSPASAGTASGNITHTSTGATTENVAVTGTGIATPVADFTASSTTATAGGSITFTDNSTNTPTSWSWSFTGGTPATSTEQNPSVTYSAAGTYNVSLTANNSCGSDTETKTEYITVTASCIIPVATVPAAGDGSMSNPYQIATLENLYWIAVTPSVWNLDAYFIQTADIDASETADWCNGGWLPIGNATNRVFSGHYNGNDHVISGLHITSSSETSFGLFGYVQNAEFSNLGITNVNINVENAIGAGALLGYAYLNTPIDNCYSTGVVKGYNHTGGLAGILDNYNNNITRIYNSYSSCNVSGVLHTGGLVGSCWADVSVINCFYTEGTVNCNYSTGGLIGYAGEAMIRKCYSTGEVIGNSGVGGLVGIHTWSAIYDSYSRCTVKNTSTFQSCGGLVGLVQGNAYVTNSYSTGPVQPGMGGLVGSQDADATPTFIYSFWDTQTSGTTTSAGGTGKTTDEMKTQTTFTDWDFTTIWGMDDIKNDGYPHLLPAPECINGTLTLISGSNFQTICAPNTAISDIVYLVGGGATGANVVSPLLGGLSGTYDPVDKTYTISGSLEFDVTNNYTVYTTGTYCVGSTAFAKGTISVNPNPEVTITGNNSPICFGANAEFYLNGTPGVEIECRIDYVGSTLIRKVRLDKEGNATVIQEDVTVDDVTLSLVSMCNNALDGTSTVDVVIPSVSISGSHTACTSATLTAVTDASSPVYSWIMLLSDGYNTVGDGSTLDVTESGDYVLVVTDGNGCMNFSEVFNFTIDNPPLVSIAGSSTISVGETTTLSPVTGGTWTSSNSAVATVTDAGLVTGKSEGTATFTFTDAITDCSATTGEITVTAASQTNTQTFTTDGTFTVPEGVTSVTVKAWGGGGGGSYRYLIDGTDPENSVYGPGAGGGGGGFCGGTINVTPNDVITITVGTGGSGGYDGTGNGDPGVTSKVEYNDVVIEAYGGYGGVAGTDGGIGGDGNDGWYTGDVLNPINNNGGNGAAGIISDGNDEGGQGGGGGGGAGDNNSGSDATNDIGGFGGDAGGGDGGDSGESGAVYGGGGGGTNGNANSSGGDGADGAVIIEWTTGTCTPPVPTFTESPGTPKCAGDEVTYTTQADKTNYVWNFSGTKDSDYEISSGGTSSDNSVTLTWLTAGSKTVTVNYTEDCEGVTPANSIITVNPLPTVTWETVLADQCADATNYELTGGMPVGGIYSGIGVTGTNFNASAAGVGTYTLSYTYTDANGCTNTATNSITVNTLPTATIEYEGVLCATGTISVTRTGQEDGTYSAESIEKSIEKSALMSVGLVIDSYTGTINLSESFPGTYIVTYSFTDNQGCSNIVNTEVKIYSLPEPLVLTASEVCAGEPTTISSTTSQYGVKYQLYNSGNTSVGDPRDGTYGQLTWSGIEAGTGYYVIGTDAITGCISPASNNVDVVVKPLPAVAITGSTTIYVGETTTLSPVSGGTWESSNVEVATVTNDGIVTGVSAGTATFTFTDGTTGCSATTGEVTVTEMQSLVITDASGDNSECQGPNPNLNSDYLLWLETHGGATISEFCGDIENVSWDDNTDTAKWSGDCPNSITVIFTATDGCGNTDNTSAIFTINDRTLPIWTTQAEDLDVIVECDDVDGMEDAFAASPTASDNCSEPIITEVFPAVITPGTCAGNYTITRTWTLSDACGNNQESYVQTIVVHDNVAPTWTTPLESLDREYECSQTLQIGKTISLLSPLATDNCSDVIIEGGTPEYIYGICDGNYQIKRTWTVSDACGNAQSVPFVQIVTVRDTEGPVISTFAENKTVECDGSGNQSDLEYWLNTHGGAEATDNCSGVNWSHNYGEGENKVSLTDGCGATGSVTVTFTATDGCGNSSTTVASFTIEDTEYPVLIDEDRDCTVLNNGFNPTWCLSNATNFDATELEDDIANLYMDFCGGVTATFEDANTFISGDDCDWTAVYTFKISDDCDNSTSCQVTYRGGDKTKPQWAQSMPVDTTVECDAIPDPPVITATDNCDDTVYVSYLQLINDDDEEIRPAKYLIIRQWNAFDNCSNSIYDVRTPYTQIITVIDTTPPSIIVQAVNDTVECDGLGNEDEYGTWLLNHAGAQASDNCADVNWSYAEGEWIYEQLGRSGEILSQAKHISVTFYAADDCENKSEGTTASFFIKDTTPPEMITLASDDSVQFSCEAMDDLNDWLDSHGGAVVSDDCSNIKWSHSSAVLSDGCGGTGETTVTFTARDACGNSSSTQATFKIIDTQAPRFDTSAEDLTVECDGEGNTDDLNNWLANHGGAYVLNNCGERITWSHNYVAENPTEGQVTMSDDCGATGFVTVTFTATDECGNHSETTATFAIEDTQPPVLNDETITSASLNSSENNWCLTNADVFAAKTLESAVAALYNDDCGKVTAFNSGKTAGTDNSDCSWSFVYHFVVSDECLNTTNCDVVYSGGDTLKPHLVNTKITSKSLDKLDVDECLNVAENWNANQLETAVAALYTDNCDASVSATLIETIPGTNNSDCSWSFTYNFKVSDNCNNSDTCRVIRSGGDNIPPSIDCPVIADAYITKVGEDFYKTTGKEFDATATDNCDSDVTLTNNLTGTSTLENYEFGFGETEVIWTAKDNCFHSSTSSFVVKVNKVLTETSVSVNSSSLQYSDLTTFTATISPFDVTVAGTAAVSVTFKVGNQEMGTAPLENGTATLADVALLEIQPDPLSGSGEMSPGIKTVTAVFNGKDSDFDVSDATTVLTINQEDADVDYIGTEIVGEANPDVTTTIVNLVASVTDDNDGHRGDIRNARVMFFNGTTPISGWLTPTLINPADLKQGIVSFDWNAPVPSVGYTTFDITVKVGNEGYYVGSPYQVPVTVYRTSLKEFITGGGHIIPVISKGDYASDPGRKVNFGFNVKWNKTMKNLQGNFNLIFRRGSEVYQIKSNALTGLGIDGSDPCSHTAVFTSKANLNRVTDGVTEIIMGNLSLQITLTDNGDPGMVDMIGITVYNGSSLIYSSNWPFSRTEELNLIAGNILVNDGLNCNATDVTHTILTSGKNPSLNGEEITFTASVFGADDTPEGSIDFIINGKLFSRALESNGTASVPYKFNETGSYEIVANYTSSNGYKSSTGSLTQLVQGTGFVLTSSKNPSVLGDEVTFTAKLSGPVTPVGTVKFFIDGMIYGDPYALTDGETSVTIPDFTVGSHTVTAVYYSTNTPEIITDPVSVVQMVNNVSLMLSSSKSTSVISEEVVFTATVNGGYSGKTVIFSIDGTPEGDPVVIDDAGNASITIGFDEAGTFAVTATLSDPVVSATLNQVVQGPVLVLVSSANPSADGNSVTFTATVTGGKEGNRVVFSIDGQPETLATLTGGVATCTKVLSEGSYLVSAVYYNDAVTEILSEASLTQVVIAENITVELVSSINPSTYGKSVTFTATVVGSATPPVGFITFRDGDQILKSVAISGSMATYSTNKLSVGTHTITASYNLNDAFGTVNQVVLEKTKSAEILPDVEQVTESVDLKVYPNPFTEKLRFEFVSPETVNARIDLYDMTGRLVKTIFEQPVEASTRYEAEFRPDAIVSAMYIYRITMGDTVYNGKVIFKKE